LQSIRIKKGLDIPLAGAPDQRIENGNTVNSIALLGPDYTGMRPRMQVEAGDPVRLGQALFTDRRSPDVPFTAPGAGVVEAVNRGARRSLQSVVIRLEGDDAETYLQTG
jgi:Na+-transporting NADH:ubiquinone oxidoreductase subunit A